MEAQYPANRKPQNHYAPSVAMGITATPSSRV